MRDHGIPYQIVNGVEFYQRKEIKDVLAYLQLINNPRDDMSLLRIINVPPRRIGKTTVQRIAEHARERGITLLEAARDVEAIRSISKRPRGVRAGLRRVDRSAEPAMRRLRSRSCSVWS